MNAECLENAVFSSVENDFYRKLGITIWHKISQNIILIWVKVGYGIG